MHKSNYELNVLVNGKPVREYYHNNKFFIEAKDGTEYSIKLKNHGHKRIMAVISIDGVDVLKGKAAVEAESGYIINAYSTINITGYRIDDNNVATFRFSDGKVSYATQVEQKFDDAKLEKVKEGEIAPARNNGVIGIRIWEEKEPKFIPAWKEASYSNKNSFYHNQNYSNSIVNFFGFSGCSPFGISISGACITGACITGGFYRSLLLSGCSSPILTNGLSYNGPGYAPSFSLGTSWGQKQEDKVVKVEFQKADTHIDLEVYYLIRDELIKIGVDLEKAKKIFVSGYPEAFGEKEEYCKQPNDWRK